MVLLSRCRSWETTRTAPENSCRAMVKARRISRSRWLVGSSSSSRLGFCQAISARARRAFSPPEKFNTGSSTRTPRKSKPPRKSLRVCSRSPGAIRCRCSNGLACGSSESSWCWAKYPMARFSPRSRRPPSSGRSPARVLISVDLPAPLGPSRPIRAPGTSCSLTFSSTALSP